MKIIALKNIIVTLFIFFCFFVLTACPSEPAMRKAAKASYSLSGLTVDAIDATAKAYDAQIISKDAKDKIAARLQSIARGGKRFNEILKEVEKSGQNPNPATLDTLNRIFSDEVVAPFLSLLEEIKVLSPGDASVIRVSIASLRTTILVISQAFETAGLPVKGDMRYA